MLDRLLKYIESENLFHREDRILLAISGGQDSSVMAELFHQSGFDFGIAHCNFRLRGAESKRDEQFVSELAERYHVPFFLHRFNTKSYARKYKLSIQMAARELRYKWFDELLDKEGYDYIANAHHLDDQIETFFINLARGTGIAGLHGILPKQGKIIRPLLFASREEIEKYARENGLPYVQDSSNASLKYARNRIRHKIIPQFEKLNPSFRAEMRETIRRIRDTEIVLNVIVDKEKKRLCIPDGTGFKIEIPELKKLQPVRTWLFTLLSDFGFTSAVVNDILASLDEQPGKVFYSTTHRIVKDRDCLLLSAVDQEDPGKTYEVYPQESENLPLQLEFNMIRTMPQELDAGQNIIFLDYDRLQFPLIVRKWRKGDYFYPFGMKAKKKLSDFFIDKKCSLLQKENTWLLCSGEDIAWIIGMRPDDRFRIADSTRKILQVRWIR